jgi:putative colanic acid biosysnthesis UDP-glucose lipid carrier transferase
MQWAGDRRPASVVSRRVPQSGAERRDLKMRADWIGKEPLTVPSLALPAARSTAWIIPPASHTKDRGANSKAKRFFDFVLALIAIFILLPTLVVVAIMVRVESPGPVFFRQWRGGYNGKRFQIFKFRTMTCMEDGKDVRQAQLGDARVTRIGRVLRKTSLDELPQLFNVLRGEMSLVGPRPHALVHDEIYSTLIKGYSDRQLVKPGMTGWAQVTGCRGETREVAAMEMRVRRDLEYIRHWSLRFDFLIMMKTVKEVLHPSDVY